jgi:hypothetical protein
VDFKFYPLRFEFTARQSLYFPPGKASNILRGALGVIFRSIACVPACRESVGGAKTCEIRTSCPYARIFEPISGGAGPSGLADSPRPFVFRARHLEGRTIQSNESFYFDLNLFSLEPEARAYFILTFAALAREGLGPNRGKAELQSVRRLAVSPPAHNPSHDASSHDLNAPPDLEPSNGLEHSPELEPATYRDLSEPRAQASGTATPLAQPASPGN